MKDSMALDILGFPFDSTAGFYSSTVASSDWDKSATSLI
jgi:hypothetical protein